MKAQIRKAHIKGSHYESSNYEISNIKSTLYKNKARCRVGDLLLTLKRIIPIISLYAAGRTSKRPAVKNGRSFDSAFTV